MQMFSSEDIARIKKRISENPKFIETVEKSSANVRRKLIIVPKLEIPEEYKNAEELGKKIVPILVFNPAPSNLTYVSDEKTSIKLAFTGDEFRGIKIFTGTSAANFLEREARFSDSGNIFFDN